MEIELTTEETKSVARHEAAHFIVAWAVNDPCEQVDITPDAQHDAEGNPGFVVMGQTSGEPRPTVFEEIVMTLAGPVSDHWEEDNAQMMDVAKSEFKKVIGRVDEAGIAAQGDWGQVLLCMSEVWTEQGQEWNVDPDTEQFKKRLSVYIDATRAILTACEAQWQEVTEYLIKHGRIGFYGPHNPRPAHVPPLPALFGNRPQPDNGEEAASLFLRWSDDGEPPKEIRDCVEKYRALANAERDGR